MSLIGTLNINRTQILNHLDRAIRDSFIRVFSDCRHRNTAPQEPDFIAGLVVYAVPDIYYSLRPIFARDNALWSVASVFCHLKPQVAFNPNLGLPCCELGDILFVHQHKNIAGENSYAALLLQAKIVSGNKYTIPPPYSQLILYTAWPAFTYYKSPPLSGSRDVNPKSVHSGAAYLLLLDFRITPLRIRGRNSPAQIGLPDNILVPFTSLTEELYGLLCFKAGRVFKDRNITGYGWSKVVWDLLERGVQKAFNRRKGGFIKRPSLSGGPISTIDGYSFFGCPDNACFDVFREILEDDFFATIYPPPPGTSGERGNFSDGEYGTSIVVFETEEQG